MNEDFSNTSSDNKEPVYVGTLKVPKAGSGDTDSSGVNSDEFFDQPVLKKRSLSSGVDFRDNKNIVD